MKTRILVTSLAASMSLGLFASAAFAQTAASTVQRDVNQQTRIEQGLKSGSLNTGEAARLEGEQSRIDRLQARDLKDGKLNPRERAQLNAAQNKASRDIKAAKTNDAKGNPQSASSQRMQADVARNVNQEKRIEQGVKSGDLTRREVGGLERGQAKVDHKEAVAGRDGHVSKGEQALVQRAENHQSRRIHREKHDGQVRKAG